MTLGEARRRFWERVFVATLVPEKPTWIGPQGTTVVDQAALGLTVSPTAVAAMAADEALLEWEKRFVREVHDETVPCEGCDARLDLGADYGRTGHGWAVGPDGKWTCPECLGIVAFQRGGGR